MLETAILALLAALGILLLFGCLMGAFLLPARGRGCCVIVADDPAAAEQINAVRFLVTTGLLRLPFYVVDRSADGRYGAMYGNDPYIKVLSRGEWEELSDTERM